MSENSKIQWTDHTFNPWTGCTKVSPGCANCYAEGWAKRSGIVKWGAGQARRRTSEANWKQPRRWNDAFAHVHQQWTWERDDLLSRGSVIQTPEPQRPRVFCASLADWLDDEVPIEWLKDLLVLIKETPNLDWLLLTKRPQNFAARIEAVAEGWQSSCELAEWWARGVFPPNIWIGTTVENQDQAESRIPELDAIPAAVRFLSCEPLLGPLNLSMLRDRMAMPECIDWVICGGESGPKARPMQLEWARRLYAACFLSGVPFFMKQLGGTRKHLGDLGDFPEDLRVREFPR